MQTGIFITSERRSAILVLCVHLGQKMLTMQLALQMSDGLFVQLEVKYVIN